jgi:hypothetical protein
LIGIALIHVLGEASIAAVLPIPVFAISPKTIWKKSLNLVEDGVDIASLTWRTLDWAGNLRIFSASKVY